MLARICVEPFTQPIAGLEPLDTAIQWRAWPDNRLPGALLQQALEEAKQSGIPGENMTYPVEAQLFIIARAGRALDPGGRQSPRDERRRQRAREVP